MNFQSTSIGCSAHTFTTQRDVIHAHGHTGSQKNSRSAMVLVYPGRADCVRAVAGSAAEAGLQAADAALVDVGDDGGCIGFGRTLGRFERARPLDLGTA